MNSNKNTTTVLKVFNSLTRTKDEFQVMDRTIKWYSCGPTVYDSAHMGHARTYISFDIIRRILESYFGYNVIYCMNITDIDDKIIKRARERHLIEQYVSAGHPAPRVIDDLKQALKYAEKKLSSEEDKDKLAMREKMVGQAKLELNSLSSAVKGNGTSNGQTAPALSSLTGGGLQKQTWNREALLSSDFSDILCDWLDFAHGRHVTDNSIFTKLPRHFESEFHADMKALNIKAPSVLTRVSEYVDEIVEFVKKIVENGYAYTSTTSVYFDTIAFQRAQHTNPKLLMAACGKKVSADTTKEIVEAEGVLSDSRQSDKKDPRDFALWKSSKPGEPSWPSPWGKGRPGWHIECSAMASAVFGQTIDVHSGGIDLRFPHHDNEIAQSEAAYEQHQWVKYFLHSGHLEIQGCKMSKSLKNFLTIQDTLAKYTFRQIRILFLLHAWNNTLDFSDDTMERALHFERIFNEFFMFLNDCVRDNQVSSSHTHTKWTQADFDLSKKLDKAIEDVHCALCDSFDTPAAMDALRQLLTHTNAYINDRTLQNKNVILLRRIGEYFDKMFRIFGLMKDSDTFGVVESVEGRGEDIAMPFIKSLVNFRERTRQFAIEHKINGLLTECDKLRDVELVDLGVKLEDRDGKTTIKMLDPEVIKMEKLRLEEEEKSRAEKVEQKKAQMEKLKRERDEKRRIPPNKLFTGQTDKYSKFDDEGFPLLDKNGEALSKSETKKLRKIFEAHKKKYEELIKLE